MYTKLKSPLEVWAVRENPTELMEMHGNPELSLLYLGLWFIFLLILLSYTQILNYLKI